MKYYKAIESLTFCMPTGKLSMRGYCMDSEGMGCQSIEIEINHKPVECVYDREMRQEVRYELTRKQELAPSAVGFKLTVSEVDWNALELVEVYAVFATEQGGTQTARIRLLSRTKKQMERYVERADILYHIDQMKFVSNVVSIHGWAATNGTQLVKASILDEAGNEIPHKVFDVERFDVVNAKGLNPVQCKCGFHVHFDVLDDAQTGYRPYTLRLAAVGEPVREICIPLDIGHIIKQTKREKTLPYKAYRSFRQYGAKKTVKKICGKLFMKDTIAYEKWFAKAAPNHETIQKQKSRVFDYRPKISFVVPMYRTNETFLKELMECFFAQTYSNWELCFADGSGEGHTLAAAVARFGHGDARIKYRDLGENLGIAGNSNAALAMATGDYIALCDHDDLIPVQTAYRIAEAVNNDHEIDVIYTDEDKVDMNGRRHFEPHFKTDFNIDLLRSVNYICHLFVVRRDILERVGGFSTEYDGAQDYDFIFRCTEIASKIHHIPEILYHWRCHMQSTAMDPASKMYAFEAGIRAIDAHYKRMGLPAHVKHGKLYGMYESIYEWAGEPLVSVLIPNKDHTEDLDVALRSLLEKCTYRNVEVIVIENNSTEDKTWEYYERIQAEYPEKVRVVKWSEGFNYSAINNYGETFANGEYLLLLNNDVEFINPASIEQMLAYCRREDVGAVGARLYYNDNTIQHAGVIVGLGGVAGHAFPYFDGDSPGYMGRIILAQDYSACTAACLMVKRSVYRQVGGFDTGLAVAFNDVDFCLKIRQAGYLIVYNPQAELFHYESKSRGFEDTPEKEARFASEIEYFQGRWREVLQAGDPYYNPNLTLDKNDFSLKNLYRL